MSHTEWFNKINEENSYFNKNRFVIQYNNLRKTKTENDALVETLGSIIWEKGTIEDLRAVHRVCMYDRNKDFFNILDDIGAMLNEQPTV